MNYEIKDYSTGYSYGETYFTMAFIEDDKILGQLNYGEYEGEPNVKMIEVLAEYRRQAIGRKLPQELQKKYPDKEIYFGMLTSEGSKLIESVTYTVEDSYVMGLLSRIKKIEDKLSMYDRGFEYFYENDINLPDGFGDDYDNLYDEMQVLKEEAAGKSTIKRFVKLDERNEDMTKELLTRDDISLISEALNYLGDKIADGEGFSSGEKYWDLKTKLENIDFSIVSNERSHILLNNAIEWIFEHTNAYGKDEYVKALRNIGMTPDEISSELEKADFDNDLDNYSISPSESLPSGWEWKSWEDGSGYLKAPDGKPFFSYDCSPVYPYNIEYRVDELSQYTVFEGSLSEFKMHAESIIKSRFYQIKEVSNMLNENKHISLDSQILSASEKAKEAEKPGMSFSKEIEL